MYTQVIRSSSRRGLPLHFAFARKLSSFLFKICYIWTICIREKNNELKSKCVASEDCYILRPHPSFGNAVHRSSLPTIWPHNYLKTTKIPRFSTKTSLRKAPVHSSGKKSTQSSNFKLTFGEPGLFWGMIHEWVTSAALGGGGLSSKSCCSWKGPLRPEFAPRAKTKT